MMSPGHPRRAQIGSLAGRRVLVTGGSGFVGAPLLAWLVAVGARVHAVSRQAVQGDGDVTWLQLDLCDSDATTRMIESARPEFVFHLAGATSAARDIGLMLPMLRSNLQATVNLLTALVPTNPERVVLAGSLEEPRPRDPKAVPTSPYSVAKWATTGYALMCHSLWELPVTSLRLAMIYGPGQRELYKLVPYVIGCLLDGTVPELTSGSRKVDWIYIDDVVEAFLAAAVAPDAPGAVLDIGSGSAVAVGEIVEMLAHKVSPGAQLRFGARPDRQQDADWMADISGARQVLGWEPRVALDEGLSRTVRFYRDQRRRGLSTDTGIVRH